jgi:protease-4
LVDEIGGEIEAREWLARERGVPVSVPAEDLKPGGLYDRAVGATFSGLLQSALSRLMAPSGAWAIWQGSVAE